MDSSKYNPMTVFRPGGRLIHVECARAAASNDATVVGVRGTNFVVWAVGKRITNQMWNGVSMEKILGLNRHVVAAYAGTSRDARIIMNCARTECQSYCMLAEKRITIELLARYIGDLKQRHTMTIGLRPFEVMCLFGGFDSDGSAHLYKTEPSGDYSEWMATAIGDKSEIALKFLEKTYKDEIVQDVDSVIKLALKGIVEVDKHINHFDVGVFEHKMPLKILFKEEIVNYLNAIEQEKQEAIIFSSK